MPDYGLSQKIVTPYTAEQNGLVERFFRSLEEECVWQHRFQCFDEARCTIERWLDWYNNGRPHQALDCLSPIEFRRSKQLLVA